ncbi:MAG: HEAT repeat domain-containing protein [Planctomycetes bacterium]|nr:HEAT repeat domain-containing protein [Planctomycetota bacterium]
MTRQPGLRGMIPWRRCVGLLGIAGAFLSIVGCAARWDELMSHQRDWRYITGHNKPHPLEVIRDNPSDGHRRAQALAELKEPLKNGGNAQDQDAYLNVLQKSATQDPLPLCRLTAVRCLGKYRDPRAARILEDVYQRQHFKDPENNSLIRKEALVALEKMQDPDSKHLLIRVARQPGPPVEASLSDRQQTQDEKIVAIRALGKFKDNDCVEALFYVMKNEKEIGPRNRALLSLRESTGKNWPAQREAWQRADVAPVPEENNFIQRVTGWKW